MELKYQGGNEWLLGELITKVIMIEDTFCQGVILLDIKIAASITVARGQAAHGQYVINLEYNMSSHIIHRKFVLYVTIAIS